MNGHSEGELWGLAVHPKSLDFVTASCDKTIRSWSFQNKVRVMYMYTMLLLTLSPFLSLLLPPYPFSLLLPPCPSLSLLLPPFLSLSLPIPFLPFSSFPFLSLISGSTPLSTCGSRGCFCRYFCWWFFSGRRSTQWRVLDAWIPGLQHISTEERPQQNTTGSEVQYERERRRERRGERRGGGRGEKMGRVR